MRIGGLNSPIITGPDSNGTVTIYDPDTGLTTTSYSDGSSVVTGNGTQTTYTSQQQLVAAAPSGAAGSSWLTSLTQALPALATFVNAQQLAQINVNRAKQNLPALDASRLSAYPCRHLP